MSDPLDHVRRMWEADRASRALGMRLVEVGEGRAVVEMAITEQHCNGFDIGHGGLTFSVADSAFALACNSHGRLTVAAGAEIRFRAPVRLGDVLVASATERERAGGGGVYDVEVCVAERVVATFVGRAAELREAGA